jgi:Glycosyl transferases group 1
MYDDERLIDVVDEFLRDAAARERIARQGYEHVRAHHTYDHRVSSVLDAIFASRAGPLQHAPLRHHSSTDVQLAYAEVFSRARRVDDTLEQFKSVPSRWRYRLPAARHLVLCLLRRLRRG